MSKNITRQQILRNRLEMASHNLLCYSANYGMTEPKEGYEEEFIEAAEEVKMLETWLKEFHSSHADSTVEYLCRLSTVSHGSTYDGKPIADAIEVEVNTGASFLDGDNRMLRVGPEAQEWFVNGDSCCGKYDIEKYRVSSRQLKITVDKINYVRSIEWAVNEDEA